MSLSTPSRYALFLSVFLSCISFSIVLPTLWPYLHTLHSSQSFLAWVVSIYSVGEAIGAIVFGRLTSYFSTRYLMLFSTSLGLIGSVMYISAQAYPSPLPGPLLIFVARFLHGVWTGAAQALQQIYLAAVLPQQLLTATTVTLNAFACFGFVIGPAFGLVFAAIPNINILGLWSFNQLTAPGWFVLIAGLGIVGLYVAVFDEQGDREGAMEERLECLPLVTMNKDSVKTEPSILALAVCNLAFFVHFFGFALQETITTPLIQMYYNWSVMIANILFTGAGICALLAFWFVGKASLYVSDKVLTSVSLLIGFVGYMLLVSLPGKTLAVYQFVLGFVFISIAFPVGRACVISLYTKLLPLEKQGTAQGIILAIGAVARIIGPFGAVKTFLWFAGPLVVFGGTATLFLFTAAIMAVINKQLDV